jgi:hypothetical protein
MNRPSRVALPRALRAAPVLLATLATLGASAGVAAAATPLAIDDTTEPLGPGIVLHHQQYLESTGWIDRQVVTADLSNAAVTSDLLHADSVAQGSALTKQANAVHAVAGINGDFFDIGNSGAALGFEFGGGQLIKSGDRNGGRSFGVSKDGVAQLINLALAANANFGGADHPLNGYNQVGVPSGKIGAYTSQWGSYDRATQVLGSANTAEVWVADGHVTQAAAAPKGGTLPAGTTALVGREAGADALKTLAVGDAVALSFDVSPALASDLRFAIGSDALLVNGGQPVNIGDSAIAPRTAVGFKDGGRTLIMLTVDGPGGTGNGGVTLTKMGLMMAGLGAETAVNMDGGGSTTMVARALGEPLATVRNVPSDGGERSDPNGIGLGITPGNGQVDDLVVSGNGTDPDDPEPRVFPGLHRLLTAKGVDNHQYPVAVDRSDVHWSTDEGSIDNGMLHAPADATGDIAVRATSATARADQPVRVLGKLRTLELSSTRLSLPDTAATATIKVTGRDGQGFATPIEADDLDLDYDHSVIKLSPSPGGLKVTPVATGGTLVTFSAAGQTVKLPVTVGVQTTTLYTFDHADELTQWTTNGTTASSITLAQTADGLQMTYPKQRNMGITKTPIASRILVPGQPLRIRVRYSSTVATEFTSLYWVDSAGASKNQLQPGAQIGENATAFTLPSDTKFPIKISQLQVIQTSAPKQADGVVVWKSIEADAAPDVELPAPGAPREDPLISPDGKTNGKEDWTFATLSDVQFTAADPELAKVGVAALKRIRQGNPDLVVLNGDITDLGAASDITLARATLEAGGCDLIKVGEEPAADSTPDPSTGKVPCYYVPGNHESYRAAGQGDLAPWTAEFGQPYRTFDHKGTRFILLNSSLGTLRSSDFAQLPMLESALQSAKTDDSVKNVMVFAHHPVDDPEESKASQLGDRREVTLVERLLTDFREASGKGVSMVGSHAQVMNVHRIEGVPYEVLPSSGKAPYGTPDHGGFTGYLQWSVDSDAKASDQWLTADVNAFAQSITLNAPETLEVGTAAPLSGSIVQPSGVQNGTRVVPLRYPMSVHWSGDGGLAIGSGDAAIDAARKARKVAILDPETRELTGLKTGSVSVKVTNQSMREYSGEASLAPVTTEKTIAVVPYTGDGPRFAAATPVFLEQPVGTLSAGQPVQVTNGGTEPLKITSVTVKPGDPASDGDFLIASDSCDGAEVAPGGTCTVLVRFAPARVNADSAAQLVFATNTAEREQTIPLTGHSVPLPSPQQGEPGAPGQDGDDGAQGPVGPQGPTGAQGPGGAKGDAGATGPQGAGGPGGPKGADGATGPQGQAGATGPKGAKGAKGDRGATPQVTVSCRLTSSRRSVSCTVKPKATRTTKAKSRVQVQVGLTGSKHTVRRVSTGSVTVHLDAGRRLRSAQQITVRAQIGSARTVVMVRPDARSRTATLKG